MSQVHPPNTVHATLNYHLEPHLGGTDIFYVGTAGEKRRKHAPVEVTIRDIRYADEEVTLDKQGFQLAKKECVEEKFDDDELIKKGYYGECERLVKEMTGATKVICMNHVVRRKSWKDALEAEKHLGDDDRSVGPSHANWVHVDQSYAGAEHRAKESVPEFSEVIARGCRWAIINVWRPIDYPATNNLLAMCDARSIPESHLREITSYLPKKDMETSIVDPNAQDAYRLKDPYRPLQRRNAGGDGNGKEGESSGYGLWGLIPPEYEGQHKWWYASEVKQDEALLLKIFDSKKTGVARRSPHTAFQCEADYGPPRHSLETRCAVLWEDQNSD